VPGFWERSLERMLQRKEQISRQFIRELKLERAERERGGGRTPVGCSRSSRRYPPGSSIARGGSPVGKREGREREGGRTPVGRKEGGRTPVGCSRSSRRYPPGSPVARGGSPVGKREGGEREGVRRTQRAMGRERGVKKESHD